MGFRTVPAESATETRLRAKGEPSWLGPGDVPINPGVGTIIRHGGSPQGILVDNPSGEPIQDVSLFRPGALAAVELGRFSQYRISNSGFLTLLEANLLTPPATGTDASNHWVVRAAGTVSGSVDLALSVEAQRHFTFNNADPVELFQSSNASAGSWQNYLVGSKFQPSSDVTITGVGIEVTTSGADDGTGHLRRIFITDEARTKILATSNEFDNGWSSGENAVSMAASADLDANTTYWVWHEWVDRTDPAEGNTYFLRKHDLWTGANQPDAPRTFLGSGETEWFDPEADFTTANNHMRLHFYGSDQGVEIAGDIVLSIVETGTAPNAQDINVRALIASED